MNKQELLQEALAKLEELRGQLNEAVEAPVEQEGVTFNQEDIDAIRGRFGDLVDFIFDIADDVRELGDDIEALFRGQEAVEVETEEPIEEETEEPVEGPAQTEVIEQDTPVAVEEPTPGPVEIPIEEPLPAPITPAAEPETVTEVAEANPLL